MKAIVCELCGSNDIIKQDGLFVCQHCGTKYTVEEAKKLMIEGPVEVQGTVKVDNSDQVKNYLLAAKRAKETSDWEKVEESYKQVELIDPNNNEAVFYNAYCRARKTLLDYDLAKRSEGFKMLRQYVSKLGESYSLDIEEESKRLLIQISEDLIKLISVNYAFDPKIQAGIASMPQVYQTHAMFFNLQYEFIKSLETIIAKYPDNDKRVIPLYEQAVRHADSLMDQIDKRYLSETSKLTPIVIEKLTSLHTGWNKIDSEHTIPEPRKSSGGCYVATSVYGSYDCPQVWTLRRYRDYRLAKTWYGRTFIKVYYAVSPTIVKWFGETSWFRNLWKSVLDKKVAKLNNVGFANTPYNDPKY